MSSRSMSRNTASDFLGPIRYPYSMSPHVASHPYRLDEAPRKRPKYTRSKTGCLTCRAKKVKCDEAKPVCTRCAHGQRECTWPNPRQSAIKASDASDAADSRSSNASSSPPVSEPPTPPIRTSTSPLRRQTAIASTAVPRQPRRASMESALPSPSTPASARPTAVQVQGRASQAVSGPRSSNERPAADYGEGLPSYSMADYAPYMNGPPNSIYNLSSGPAPNEGMLYGPSSHLDPYYTLPHVNMPPDLGRSTLAAPWEGDFDAAVPDAVATKPYDLVRSAATPSDVYRPDQRVQYHPVPVHAARRFTINPYSPSDYHY